MLAKQNKQFGSHTIDTYPVKNYDTACKRDLFDNLGPIPTKI